MKSNMAASVKLKAKIGENQIMPGTKILFLIFQRNLELEFIFNNLMLIFFESGDFL